MNIQIVRDSLAKALASPAATLVEDEALPQYIAKRRWLGLKDQTIKAVRVTDLVNIGDEAREILLTVAEVKTTGSDDALASAVGGSLGGRAVYSAPQYARSGARAAWPAHGFAHRRLCSASLRPSICYVPSVGQRVCLRRWGSALPADRSRTRSARNNSRRRGRGFQRANQGTEFVLYFALVGPVSQRAADALFLCCSGSECQK